MNPNLDDGNCFQYAIMVALKHEISKTNPVRRKKRHFKNQYEWKDKDFPAHTKN